MVAFADLLAAQPDIWRELATVWLRLGQQLDDRSGDLHGHIGRLQAVWHGKDAEMATTHGGQLVTSWRQRSAEALRIGQVLGEFADRADTAQRRANAAVRAAFPTYLVAADGAVTVDPILEARPSSSPSNGLRWKRARKGSRPNWRRSSTR